MKWLHNLLKGVSLTACLFVFQACYGPPPGYPEDFFEEEKMEATVEPTAETPAEEIVEAELTDQIVTE